MKIIDSHCHPQLSQFDNDRDLMIKRSLDSGIGIICIGTNIEDSIQGVEISNSYENVWAVVGIHPNDIFEKEINIKSFENLLSNKKVVGIGEIGLDYYRTPERDKQIRQQEVFNDFIDLAKRNSKPIVIHSRDAGKGSLGLVHSDSLNILRNKNISGVAHSFTGTIDEAREYLNLGFYLGLNGIITFADQYEELVRFIPLNRILLETDAPFLAPKSRRGERNEPMYIEEVAQKISSIKNVSLEDVLSTTILNCKELFRL